jgi:hypothetical protein
MEKGELFDKAIVQEQMMLQMSKYRGQFISVAIEMERCLDYYIASQFADSDEKKYSLIIHITAPYLQMQKKIEVFETLSQKNNPELKERIPDIYSNIRRINDDRNKFAHYSLDFSDEAMKDFSQKQILTLVKLKPTKPNKEFPEGGLERFGILPNIFIEIIKASKSTVSSLMKLVGWL